MQGYVKKTHAGIHALIREDLAGLCTDRELQDLCRRLFDPPPAGRLIKQGAYKRIFRDTVRGIPCVVKTYSNTGLLRRLKSLVAPARAMQEFHSAAYIAAHGIPTARPVIVAEQKTLGTVSRSAVALEFIDNARELRDFFFYDQTTPARERWHIAEEFGRLTARIFQSGIYQYDYALNNMLIRFGDSGFDLFFIDFERVEILDAVSRAQKIDILARLDRVGAEISMKDRMRFLRGYLDLDPGIAPDLHALAAEMLEVTVRAVSSDYARGRLTSIYTHARYDRLSEQGWTGLCKKGLDPRKIAAALTMLPAGDAARTVTVPFEGSPLPLQAASLGKAGAENTWAALTALIIAGMPVSLPEVLACRKERGFILARSSLKDDCRLFFDTPSAASRFVQEHFPDEIGQVKSFLAKM